MGNDISPVLGFVVEVAKAGVLLGRVWNWAIESVNARIDQWLWEEDWAWANNARHQRAQS